MGVHEVRPPDLPHYVKPSQTSVAQCTADCFLTYMCVLLYLSSHMFVNGGRSGQGLATARGRLHCHMTIAYICMHVSWHVVYVVC
jgi:hypothetical protein